MITTLEDFKAYNLAMEVAEEVWNIVIKWGYFEKDVVGKQFVKALDSIAANLSEGLGRYHYREAENFAYNSRGSLFETKTWLSKCMIRRLVTEEQFSKMTRKLDVVGRMINGYINSIGEAREPDVPWTGNAKCLIPNAQ